MSTVYDENTIQEFVAENRDHLEEIEPDLLAMEKGGTEIPAEIINRVFRAIHSIKGSSGFFDFRSIKDLSHVMENVLMLIRDGRLVPDESGIDALLAGVDKLRIMFADVENSDHVSYQDDLDRLNAILESSRASEFRTEVREDSKQEAHGKKDPAAEGREGPSEGQGMTLEAPEGSGMPAAVFSSKAGEWIREAKGGGNYIYLLWHSGGEAEARELAGRMETYGGFFGPGGASGEESETPYLFATVMEPDLLSEALGVPPERVVRLEGSAGREKNAQASRDKETPDPLPYDREGAQANREDKHPYETIRVSVDLIDKLMNLAGELVLGRNQLRQELDETAVRNPKLNTLIQTLDVVTSEVQEKIMQMRMQPVGNLFNKFTRVVRDLSKHLGKEVELAVGGREVELDKSILEGLSDPVTHLVRNSLDHGLETPEEREAAGKPAKGRLEMNAFHEGGQVNITITDDGRGIYPAEVARKAVANRRISEEAARRMTDKEKVNLIFMPGFSTARAVSDISGRGVGMDVVKTNIERLGGHLEVESFPGKGSCVRIRLPLTLAIIPSLVVGAGGFRFAIPQINVKELVCVRAGEVSQRIEEVAGAEVLRLRGSLLPLVRLSTVLGIPGVFRDPETGEPREDRRAKLADRRAQRRDQAGPEPYKPGRRRSGERRQSWHSDLYVVVLKLGENRFGLCVEELFDTEEIVVKPLSDQIKDVKCFAGATIMGDGRVAMILDAAGIAGFDGLRFSEITAEERRRQEEEASRREAEAGEQRSILLFNCAPDEQFALPLESVSRLERIRKESIQRVGDSEFMDYRGHGLPLVRLDRLIPVRPLPEDSSELYVIIPKTDRVKAGILASSILDTMETQTLTRPSENGHRGLSGSAFVEGKLTLFLDPEPLIRAAAGTDHGVYG